MAGGSSRHSGVPGQRLPGAVNLLLTVLIVAIVGTLALRASSQEPPSIAEFAPQAQQPIKDAPEEQTSVAGQGGEGLGIGGVPTPSVVPSSVAGGPPKAIDRGQVRHCIGNPPRQTEDPQSPPCVPYWT